MTMTTRAFSSRPGATDALRFVLNLPFAYLGTALLLLFAYFTRPMLLSPLLLLLIVRQAAPLGIAVIGQSVCMRVLSLDLSIGGVIVAVSYILTSGALPYPPPVLIAICILFGLVVGLANAFFITRLRASSVIVTLAMAMILSGVVISLGQFYAPGDAPEVLKFIGQKRIGIVPIALLVWLALLIPFALFLRFSVFGRYVDAIGSNPNAAWVSGIPYIRVLTVVHVMSSLFAVASGLLLVGFVGVGSMDIGSDLALNSLAAVILGGVTFGSGKGGVLGPAVAAFMLTFSFNLLTSLGLGEPGKLMLQGAIIAVAAMAYAVRMQRT
ncbi:ABC transporter permease [Oceanicola sp. 22II-s10i]|uniref:ABC transporter permease n=1 Tax=Oceanicola sp. 22II-s10i TaxID=1317116 RepID=UPI000B5238B3|nr:ABC transporter permease [Oceanicola sp. 22II-s10i]